MVTLRSRVASQIRVPASPEAVRPSANNRPQASAREAPDRIDRLAEQVQALTATVQAMQKTHQRPTPASPERPARSPSRRASRHSGPRPTRSPSRRTHRRITPDRSAHSRTHRPKSPARDRRYRSLSPLSGRGSHPERSLGIQPPPRGDDLNRRIEELQQQVAALQGNPRGNPDEVNPYADPPFDDLILREKIPSRFKMPQMDPYDGTTDPVDHLASFRALMMLQGATDAAMCKAFPATLRKTARHWFSGLKPGSIHSFEQLGKIFSTYFASSRVIRKGSDALLNIKQKDGETLREYLTRFNAAVLETRNLDPSIAMSALKGGLKAGSLLFSLEKRFPTSFPEMLARAEKYANAEEAMKARRNAAGSKEEKRGKRKRESPRRPRSPSPKKRSSRSPKESRRARSPFQKFHNYTPLTAPRTQILMEIDGRGYLRTPGQMRTPLERRDKKKYCHYHRDVGHNTEDCIQLRDEIEALIRRGHLSQYLRPKATDKEKQPLPPEPDQNRPTAGVINIISRGRSRDPQGREDEKKEGAGGTSHPRSARSKR